MLKRGDGWGTRQRKPQAGSKKQQRRYSLHHYLLVALWVWFLVLQWEISPFLNNCDAHGVAEAETKDVCFLTCIFGDSTTEVDLPANVEWFQEHWCPSARFDLVTNLPDIVAPGWTKHIRMAEESSSSSSLNSTKNYSNIVQSREAKFLAWKVLPYTRNCRMVVYLDGYLTPRSHSYYIWSTLGKFQRLADQVQASEWGLAQVEQPYFNGLTMTEIFNQTILNMGKDTVEHANATLTWMKQQKDYQEIMPYYLNKYFAYDPNNPKYQELSSWFWKQYTTHQGSWRDQPLWALTMHHFHAKPVVMTYDKRITRGGDLFTTGGVIGWNQHVHVITNDE